ncbi:uncharacterized protein J4E84_010142 [Alternaria hordeiaustralica]|uniref:uncharacterized protein n=1 Tax=Alternaria hordeiaustralica TaxID=1187925 RepID=UPI0020C1D0BA|nr:uncharacterized protein J4E84_010142 [Alternaria hordeiaustralica]KAI4675400.1 hypothetical protein J4E84_010142 [Alternaria hordeiaustralica]
MAGLLTHSSTSATLYPYTHQRSQSLGFTGCTATTALLAHRPALTSSDKRLKDCADPTDSAHIARPQGQTPIVVMSNLNEEYGPEDMAWVAADVQMREEQDLNRALEASRASAGTGVPPRPTSARVTRQSEAEDEELLVALDISRIEAEKAAQRRNADAEADQQRLLEAQRQSEREARAADQEREHTFVALSISQAEAEEAERRRNADIEADQQRLLEAQRQSGREALAADQGREATRKAELQSLKDERARAQAARLDQETLDQTIVESKVAAEIEQQHAQRSTRLLETYAVRGLSEDEQLQMALRQSQDEEHSREVAQVGQDREDMLRWVNEHGRTSAPSNEPSATQSPEDRPVLGAMASYPPGPVTEQEQRSVADAREVIDNPNVLYRPLTPISEASASRPASLRSVAADQARRSNIVTARTTTDHSRIDIRLPYPPGALLTPPASDRSRSSIRSVSSGRPPSYHTVEENLARRLESFEVPHDTSNESQTDEEPPLYPGAYPPSPSQAESAAPHTVLGPRPILGTPLLPGAYPPSYASSRAPRSEAGAFSETPVQESVVARRPLGNRGFSNVPSVLSNQDRNAGSGCSHGDTVSIRSDSFPGAYPPSSQASRAPSRLDTVSSGGTFFTAQETQRSQPQARPQSALSDLWNHRDRDSHQHEGSGPRPFTPVSVSSQPSDASSAIRPPSSRTSQGSSIARKPVAKSQHATSVAAEHLAPVTVADAVSPSDVISSALQQEPVRNIFNAPVSVTINNFPEAPKSSQNLLKQVFNKSRQTNKGVKAVEQKGAEFYVKGVAEATSNLWKNKRKIFPARSSKSAGNAVIHEAREIDRFPVVPAHDDVGTIASPWPARQCLHVVNADPTRSVLSTPETTRLLQSEMAGQQSEEVDTPRPSTLQRSLTSPPLTATIPSRPMSLDQSTVSQISDVNGNAVTPPSVCQSRVRSSMDSFRCASELRPQPLDIRKRPPPVPPKPLELASSIPRTAPPPPPPLASRNPMTRRMLSEQEEGPGWVQQPVHLAAINPTQEPTMGSPDSMTVTPPTPRRINVDLNRRSHFGPIDTSLANVPPGERRIDEFSSRSMMDLGMMGQVGNPMIMEPLRGQYEQTYARPPHVQQERLNSDARAKKREKDTQKALRKQF